MIAGRGARVQRAPGVIALGILAACLIAALSVACGDRPTAIAASFPDGGGPPRRPNVVWIVADALAPPFGRHIAALAEQGVSYDVASPPSASAAANRSALLTGVDPQALGLVDGGFSTPPSAGVAVVPERLRRAGYYTSRAGSPLHNLSVAASDDAGDAGPAQPGLLGAWDAAGSDADWRSRRKDWEHPCTVSFGCGGPPHDPERPFFALFDLTASGAALDAEVGRVLAALAEDGLERTTAVFLIGGAGEAPVVTRWPAAAMPDATGGGHVRLVDLAPTALALAGVPVPVYMTGRALPVAGQHHPAAASANPTAPEPAAPIRPAAGGDRSATGIHAAAARPPGREAKGNGPPAAAAPAGYPTGGLFHVAPRVELWCDTEGSTIVYTTEREAPFYWRLYTGPFRMRFWTLRVQCGRLGYRDSEVVRYEFDIE